jgi:hypothetical protein
MMNLAGINYPWENYAYRIFSLKVKGMGSFLGSGLNVKVIIQ